MVDCILKTGLDPLAKTKSQLAPIGGQGSLLFTQTLRSIINRPGQILEDIVARQVQAALCQREVKVSAELGSAQ